MEGSLGNGVFSEDYAHFEQNHAEFPVEAQSVFQCVASLRDALGEFRKATEHKCVVDDVRAIASIVTEDEEAKSEAVTEEVVCEALAEASLEDVESPTHVADVSFSE